MKKITALFTLILTLCFVLISCSRGAKAYSALEEFITVGNTVTLGESTEKDGATYTRTAKAENGKITLNLTVSENAVTLYTFTLTVCADTPEKYEWDYERANGEKMYGNIIPEEYKKGAYSLSYIGTTIKDMQKASAASGLAKSLCDALLTYLDTDLSKAELNAYELGFDDYKK